VQHPVITQIEKADKAIVAEDFDTLLDIYTDDAILVVEPGRNAIGKNAIRKAFEAIAVYFKNGLQVRQEGLKVLESGETALVLANTVISAPNLSTITRKATYVFIKGANGNWLCSIDNSYGHEIIGIDENALKMGPQYVTRRGQDAVVILSVKEYQKITTKKPTFKEFLLSCPQMDDGFEFERQKDYPRDVEF